MKNIKKYYNNSFLSQKRYLKINNQFDDFNCSHIVILIEKFSVEKQIIFLSFFSNKIFTSILLKLSLEKRQIILHKLRSKDIVEKIFSEINFYDAIQIMKELSNEKKNKVINKLKYKKYGKKILFLLNYKYNSNCVGNFIDKKIVTVYANLNIFEALYIIRKQAQCMKEVYSIYVVDSKKKLLGSLSLKKTLTASIFCKINKIFNPKVYFVRVDSTLDNVKKIMKKYNLIELPVIDKYGILLGKVTLNKIDNHDQKLKKDLKKNNRVIFDFFLDIKTTRMNIFNILKSRLPWLLIGMFGGLIGSYIIQFNEIAMKVCPTLIFFIPLIAATAGNVGVQTSAIVVQRLANQQFNKESIFINVCKEILIGLFSGSILSLSIFVYNLIFSTNSSLDIIFTISISLLLVIVFAACIGAFVPLFLNKLKINPAVATGPFITTSNDIFGILLYFTIAKLILKF